MIRAAPISRRRLRKLFNIKTINGPSRDLPAQKEPIDRVDHQVMTNHQSELSTTRNAKQRPGAVAGELGQIDSRTQWAGLTVELVPIKTTGDKILNVPLADVGGKGLFTKEIDEALLADRIDVAVHSMKDIPYQLPNGIDFGAIPEREDPHDAFISNGRKLGDLPPGAVIGTSSLRRQVQLRHRFPSIRLVPLRGNVDYATEESGFRRIRRDCPGARGIEAAWPGDCRDADYR